MEDYVGKICPFCKTAINEGDEVTVCPECNIPHHTACWQENKGCTTFGCSQQHYEEQHTNPTSVCANCGEPLGDGQMFCPKCGTPKNEPRKRFCQKCGCELADDQQFCPRCGQKADMPVDAGVNAAISQFNAEVTKTNEKAKKKTKVLPIVLAVVVLIAAIGGYFTYSTIQKKKLAEAIATYKANAETFSTSVLASGVTMEDIGNEIKTAWYDYVKSYRYHGSRNYSVDSAIDAAQDYEATDISTVKGADSAIQTLYNLLLTVPDTDDQMLMEIKEAVKDVYEDYQDMYDCVITPSGNYTSWTSEFSDCDSNLSDSLDVLSGLLK